MSTSSSISCTGLANDDTFGRLCTPNCIIQLFYRLPFFRHAIVTAYEQILSRRKTKSAAEKISTEKEEEENTNKKIEEESSSSSSSSLSLSLSFSDDEEENEKKKQAAEEEEVKNEGIIVALAELFQEMMAAENQSNDTTKTTKTDINVRSFLKAMGKTLDHFDFHELFTVLLDDLTKSKIGQEVIGPVIDSYFCGVVSANITSIDGTYTSSRYEKFYNMQFSNPSTKEDSCKSITDLMSLKTEAENCEGVWCDFDDGRRETKEVKKFETINRCPPVFLCTIQRFDMDFNTMRKMKRNNPISYATRMSFGGFIERSGERFDAAILGPQLIQKARREAERYNYPSIVPREQELVASLIRQQQMFSDEKTGRSVFLYPQTEREEKEAAAAPETSMLQPIYKLFAVVEHEGRRTDSGHYCIVVKCFDGKFRRFRDDLVQVIDDIDEYVASRKAREECLMLVFIREGTDEKVFKVTK